MNTPDAPDPREARANELYWESDESVNQIAEELDVSKGSLYGMIHPLAADLACPECGAGMEYPNRTARDKGFVACPSCGFEDDDEAVEEAQASGEGAAFARSVAAGAPGGPPSTERMMAGAALLGAAAGFVLGRLTRR